MGMTIAFRGGTKFEISTERHSVIADQPVEDGGTDAGMSPVELFVAALAGCVGYFVGRYCARHAIPCDGFTIHAEWSIVERPHRIGRYRVVDEIGRGWFSPSCLMPPCKRGF
jgi:uncharacterized OsmC-like protein